MRDRSLCSFWAAASVLLRSRRLSSRTRCWWSDKPELAQYDPEVWASAVAQIAQQGEADTVLIGGSRSGREYSPRVAVKLDAALIEDAISLLDRNGVFVAAHYTFLARVTETVEAESPVTVVTVKPGAFAPAQALGNAAEQYDAEVEAA